jgi:hypothetical protein
VVSADAKKKELIGEYSNAGQEYQPKGKPARSKVHDFIDPEMGKAIPYGVYADEGWVSVDDDADTTGFAVATIPRWWARKGNSAAPRPPDCSSVPTPAGPTATGSGRGGSS